MANVSVNRDRVSRTTLWRRKKRLYERLLQPASCKDNSLYQHNVHRFKATENHGLCRKLSVGGELSGDAKRQCARPPVDQYLHPSPVLLEGEDQQPADFTISADSTAGNSVPISIAKRTNDSSGAPSYTTCTDEHMVNYVCSTKEHDNPSSSEDVQNCDYEPAAGPRHSHDGDSDSSNTEVNSNDSEPGGDNGGRDNSDGEPNASDSEPSGGDELHSSDSAPEGDDPDNSDDDPNSSDDDPNSSDHDPDGNGDPNNDNSEEESSDGENFNFNHGMLNRVLQCLGRKSIKDALIIMLSVSVRHNLSYEALIDILTAVNELFEIHLLPTSKYQLWKVLQKNENGIELCTYCSRCLSFLGLKVAIGEGQCECGTAYSQKTVKYFITLSLKKQLKELLRMPGIADHLMYRETRWKRDPDALEDIFDGAAYKALQQPGEVLSSRYNYSYTFNTDGFQVTKSSKTTAWPVYVLINELPPNMRQKHMMLVGVWVDSVEPVMNVFLDAFVNQANVLTTEGVAWKPDGVNTVHSKFVPVVCCVDSMARPAMLEMNVFHGQYGCTFCLKEGVHAEGAMRYPVLEENDVAPLRTDESIREDMLVSCMQGRVVHGVKGPSVLMNLYKFNLATGFVVDSMHCVFAGVIKRHMEFLLTSVGREYYIGTQVTVKRIDRRLLQIKPPTAI